MPKKVNITDSLIPDGRIEVTLIATDPEKVTIQQFVDLREELREAILKIRFSGKGAKHVDVQVK